MPVKPTPATPNRTPDPVEMAGKDSFPASDPVSPAPGSAPPAKPLRPSDLDQPDPDLVEVVEHPISNPAARLLHRHSDPSSGEPAESL